MSGNTFGLLFTVTTFGESHGPALGCVVDGCPPGLELDKDDIQRALHETLNNLRAAPVMKYFAPSCLPYRAALAGLKTGFC